MEGELKGTKSLGDFLDESRGLPQEGDGINALALRLRAVMDAKDEITEVVSELSGACDVLKARILNQLKASGQPSVHVKGAGTVYVKSELFAKVEDEGIAMDSIRDLGIEPGIIKTVIDRPALTRHVKSRLEAGHPEEIPEGVNYDVKESAQIRRS